MTDEVKPNEELFAKLNVPFADQDAANDAVKAFYKDLEAAREKHGITNIAVVVQIKVKLSDGDLGDSLGQANWGDLAMSEGMLAYAYGQEKRRRDELMSKLLAGRKRA